MDNVNGFPDGPDNFSGSGGAVGGNNGNANNWHRPFPGQAPSSSAGLNGQFPPPQDTLTFPLPHPLPSYTNLNIPHHSSSGMASGGATAADDMVSRRRSGSGSGGSEFNSNSEADSPTANAMAMAPPFAAALGLNPGGGVAPSMSPNAVMESGSLYQQAAGMGSDYQTALIGAVSSQNPNLMRQYVHLFGSASGQRRQRSEKKPIPDEQKDNKYFERRRRNNGAAKRSRDLRKRREDDVAIRASSLQKANAILGTQLQHLKSRQQHLRFLVCSDKSVLTEPKYFNFVFQDPTA